MRSSVCGRFSIFFFTLHLLLCSFAHSMMARPRRPRPVFTAAKARSKPSDVTITLDAGGAGDGGVDQFLESAQEDPSLGHGASNGNLGRGGGDGPGGQEPQQLRTTALNLDLSLCYAPLNYSDEEMNMTEFINTAPFYSLLQDFAPPSMAELFNDSSLEEEMDVVQGWVAARPCSDYLQSVEIENYIKRRFREMWDSNDVGENIQPNERMEGLINPRPARLINDVGENIEPNEEWRSWLIPGLIDDSDHEGIQLITDRTTV